MGVAWVGVLPALTGAALVVADLARPAGLGAMEPAALAAPAPQWAPAGQAASPNALAVSAGGMGGGPRVVSALTRAARREVAGGVGISAEVGHALLVQEGVARRFTLAGLSADSLLSGHGFALSAGLSTWLEGLAPKLVGGFVGVAGASASGASWSARLAHDPIWRAPVGIDPLRGLRVQDLEQLDPRLAATACGSPESWDRASAGERGSRSAAPPTPMGIDESSRTRGCTFQSCRTARRVST